MNILIASNSLTLLQVQLCSTFPVKCPENKGAFQITTICVTIHLVRNFLCHIYTCSLNDGKSTETSSGRALSRELFSSLHLNTSGSRPCYTLLLILTAAVQMIQNSCTFISCLYHEGLCTKFYMYFVQKYTP